MLCHLQHLCQSWGTEIIAKVTCWSIYLDIPHSPSSFESSCQPSVASGSIFCLSYHRALSLHLPPHTQEEGSKEKKNLFLGLLKSFFLLVSWPRYFITVPTPNSPSLGLTLLEHESHRDWQNICFPALPPPSPETHHKDDYFGRGGRKEKGGKIQERKKSIYISK